MGFGIKRICPDARQWHDSEMKILVTVVLLLSGSSVVAADAAQRITGRVVDESGDAITAAVVNVSGDLSRSGPDGRFEANMPAEGLAIIHLAAEGFYDAIHTVGETDIGSITLVARQPNRQLLLFAGDAMLARRYFEPPDGEPALVRRNRILGDGKMLLEAVKPYIQLADYASVNLETQLSKKQPKQRLPKSVTFYSPPELPQIMQWAGFDYVALGNNHTWDYREDGLTSTFAALEKTDLGYSGAGFDESAARAPHATEIGGQPYTFLSYVGWAGSFSPSQAADGPKGGAALGGSTVFREDLAAMPADATSVLQYHSGLEYNGMPAMSERTRMRLAVDEGADIAIGHHAHVLQGLEIYRGQLIAYSMGNFLFDQYHYTTQMGMLLYVWMDGDKLHRAEVVPLHINGYVPTPASGSIRYSVLHRLARLSRPFGTCLRSNGAHAVVAACDDDATQVFDLGSATPGTGPVNLTSLDIAPTAPVSFTTSNYQYRLGTDILRRGDFESAGLFGTIDRGWITGKAASIETRESQGLVVKVADGKTERTGMKVFERVFTLSNPTTLSGRIYTSGPATIRFHQQRRRTDDALTDALESGPIKTVGALRTKKAGWHRFSFDFDQPRLTTRSVRLLIDVSDDIAEAGGSEVVFDDMAWIEWRTPWFNGDNSGDNADFATHVQFRSTP